jgi:hypothetical protein
VDIAPQPAMKISRNPVERVRGWRFPPPRPESALQRILLGLAILCMVAGAGLWWIRNPQTFLFLGMWVLLMIAVYAIEYTRT